MHSGRLENQFFIGLLVGALALVLLIFFPMLNAVILGITLTILFHPVYVRLLKIIPNWDGTSAFVTILLAILIILVPLAFFGYRIFEEARGLYINIAFGGNMPRFELLQEQFPQLMSLVSANINEYTKQILSLLLDNFSSILSKFVSVIFTLFFALFTMYYLLKDGTKIHNAIIRTSPLSQKHTSAIISKLSIMERATVRGTLVVAVVQGLLVALGFFIFGLSNPVLWGMIAIFAALVPMLGTALVIVPGILILALTGNIMGTIGLTIWGVLLVGLIDNFLGPNLIEHGTKIHPMPILFSVIGGLFLFGPMGFLLGPLALSFLLALLDMYPTIILDRDNHAL
ncbi:MAG: AI-2E family transporter [Patescibacteria group bacterium]